MDSKPAQTLDSSLPVPDPAQGATALYFPPSVQQQQYAPAAYPQMQGAAVQQYPLTQQPQTIPHNAAAYAAPSTVGNYHPGQQYMYPAAQAAPSRPPLVSIISPEEAKKIRKMQLVNFACTMLHLGCALAIIIVVRNRLTVYNARFVGPGVIQMQYACYAATAAHPETCEYAYSLASISIFLGFILSLMQCLTMDCCGMGRGVEAMFDAFGVAWWLAGAATLGARAAEANAVGIPQQDARNAIVAMAAISAFLFLALLVTNLVLVKKLGKAYKAAQQQLQQHLTAPPIATPVNLPPPSAAAAVVAAGPSAYPPPSVVQMGHTATAGTAAQAQPGTAAASQAQPGMMMHPQAQPGLAMHPQAQPGMMMQPQAQPVAYQQPGMAPQVVVVQTGQPAMQHQHAQRSSAARTLRNVMLLRAVRRSRR